MGKTIRALGSFVAGILVGCLLVSMTVYFFPYAHQSGAQQVLARFDACESKVESFFVDIPANVLAATHGGTFPFKPYPPGTALLDDPNLRSGLAVLTRFSDHSGKVIGFATELETISPRSNLLRGLLMTDTYWSLVIPGRGSVHLYQTENNWKFVKTVVLPTLITRKSWTGNWPDLHTLGPLLDGSGRIIGGSGEFQGITGSFVEIGTTKRFSPNGDLAGEIELRLCYRIPTG